MKVRIPEELVSGHMMLHFLYSVFDVQDERDRETLAESRNQEYIVCVVEVLQWQ